LPVRGTELSRHDHEAAEEEAQVSAIRTLMAGIIDYAGLFPPASLSLEQAVANFDAYRRGEDAWALRRFVVPATRLDALARALGARPAGAGGGEPWRVSALLGANLSADVACVGAFNQRMSSTASGDTVLVDAVELKADSAEGIVRACGAIPSDLTSYVELPLTGDPAMLVGALANTEMRAKLRTGGVTAEAFPAAADLARMLAACIDAGIPFKATAGLHHPIRAEYRLTYDPDSPTGTMFGFLNVFLAAALLRAGASSADATRMLEETDASAIEADDTGVSWRGRRMSAAELRALRQDGAVSFGSCSFEEPLSDLRRLALL
jgi:hypothetical protein